MATLVALQQKEVEWATLSCLYFVGAYGVGMYSYVAYHRRQDPTWIGIYALLQLPVLTYEGLQYALNNGVWFLVGLKAPANLTLQFDLYTIKFNFSLESSEPTVIGVNMISCLTLYYLFVRYKPPISAPTEGGSSISNS
ncbi:hypothetical protein [Hymenobacter qilianensis]|uniref:Uncharacterized protein n=1 Tax=Hymenobacter qilianensis TaxID=1385715 RepID=A0A7H0H1V6_9BACT|nr:hypothetical protein [Hymenobacter qilianensis]QNP54522.1 hypothetical protein H9L05_22695 [Hymenobacter qilianensis]